MPHHDLVHSPALRKQLLSEALPVLKDVLPSEASIMEEAGELWLTAANPLEAPPARALVYFTLFQEYSLWRFDRVRMLRETEAGYRAGRENTGHFARFLRERSSYGYDLRGGERRQLSWRIERLIGSSNLWAEVVPFLRTAVSSRITTLITGETGAGKDQIVRILHELGTQSHKPLLRVSGSSLNANHFRRDLAALVSDQGFPTDGESPEDWLAPFGTVHFARIGRMPLPLQEWLVTYLRDRNAREDHGHEVAGPRLVFTSSLDLEQAMRSGRFLKSLFFEIGIFQTHLPALKDHRETIPTIATQLLARLAERDNLPVPQLGVEAIQKLKRHPWPGNLAELRNVLTRALWHGRSVIRSKDIYFDRIFWGMNEEEDDRLFEAVQTLEKAGFATGVVMVEQVVQFLLERGDDAFKAAELTKALGCAAATARGYLQELRRLGFVKKYGEKKATRYRIVPGWLPRTNRVESNFNSEND